MEDWAAVAEVVDRRVNELGWPQGELASRSGVSRSIVREIQHHIAERRRNARTLEALSTTLGWERSYLAEVVAGRQADGSGVEPQGATRQVLESRGDLEKHLVEMIGRLDALQDDVRTMLAYVRGER